MGNHFLSRINRLRETLALKKSECFFTLKSEDVRYLTGFNSSNGNLFVTLDRVKILTDKRYTHEVKKLPEFVEYEFIEPNFFESLKRIIGDLKIKKFYYEHSKLTLAQGLELRRVQGLFWTGLKDQLNYFYAYQDENAIQKTKKAVKLTEKIFNELLIEIKEGLSEIDLRAELIYKLSKVLNGKISFEPIILFGKNSAYPHGVSSTSKLKKNSAILIDFGLSIDGFTSDFTRTLFFGKPNQEFLKYYSIVRDAFHIAIENLQLNLKAKSLYQVVIDYFSKYNLEKFFTHGLGHGLGIYLHNYPHISKETKDVIKENLAIALEPALYFENRFGIRIEQDVLITKDKKEVLNKSTDELIIL
ncbi:MAG: M24 family metallopeptidase [Ignavibacteria bacterium]